MKSLFLNLKNSLKKYFIPHEGNNYKPHSLRHKSALLIFLVVILAELGFLVQVFVVFDKTKLLATVLPSVLTFLTNEKRQDNDAPPLVENELLKKAAEQKAQDMATLGYFAHTSPEGKTPWYWLDQVGYRYAYAGENLAVNFFESSDVEEAWMNSPTHRANIVRKDFTEIGIGVARGQYQGRSTVFVAQFFGKPVIFASEKTPEIIPEKTPAKILPSPKPAPKPVTPVTSKPVVASTPSAPIPIQNINPIAVKVLGDETSPAPTPVPDKESAFNSFIKKVLTSPRQSVGYLYEVIAVLIFLALAFAIFIESRVQHPLLIARGFALIVVILLISYFNISLLNLKTKVPTDDHNITANVLYALPE